MPAPLTHSFIHSLIHTHIFAARSTQSIYTHEQPMEFFSHCCKGSVALKGNLLFSIFFLFFLLFAGKHTTQCCPWPWGILCAKKAYFPVPWAAHLHSHIHTDTCTQTHAGTFTARLWRTFVIIIQKRHIGAHLNWFHFGPVPVRQCLWGLWVYVRTCVCVWCIRVPTITKTPTVRPQKVKWGNSLGRMS